MSTISKLDQDLAGNSEFTDVLGLPEFIESEEALSEVTLLNPEFAVDVRRVYVNLIRVSGALALTSSKLGFLKRQQEFSVEAMMTSVYVKHRTDPKSTASVDDAKKMSELAANRLSITVLALTNAKNLVDDRLKALDKAIYMCDGLLRSLTVEARRGL